MSSPLPGQGASPAPRFHLLQQASVMGPSLCPSCYIGLCSTFSKLMKTIMSYSEKGTDGLKGWAQLLCSSPLPATLRCPLPLLLPGCSTCYLPLPGLFLWLEVCPLLSATPCFLPGWPRGAPNLHMVVPVSLECGETLSLMTHGQCLDVVGTDSGSRLLGV